MLEECLVRVMNRIIVKTMFILVIRLYLYFLPESIIVSPMRPFLIYIYIYVIRQLAVVGFSPLAYNAGVFGKARNHT